jgi:hypothetical protein
MVPLAINKFIPVEFRGMILQDIILEQQASLESPQCVWASYFREHMFNQVWGREFKGPTDNSLKTPIQLIDERAKSSNVTDCLTMLRESDDYQVVYNHLAKGKKGGPALLLAASLVFHKAQKETAVKFGELFLQQKPRPGFELVECAVEITDSCRIIAETRIPEGSGGCLDIDITSLLTGLKANKEGCTYDKNSMHFLSLMLHLSLFYSKGERSNKNVVVAIHGMSLVFGKDDLQEKLQQYLLDSSDSLVKADKAGFHYPIKENYWVYVTIAEMNKEPKLEVFAPVTVGCPDDQEIERELGTVQLSVTHFFKSQKRLTDKVERCELSVKHFELEEGHQISDSGPACIGFEICQHTGMNHDEVFQIPVDNSDHSEGQPIAVKVIRNKIMLFINWFDETGRLKTAEQERGNQRSSNSFKPPDFIGSTIRFFSPCAGCKNNVKGDGILHGCLHCGRSVHVPCGRGLGEEGHGQSVMCNDYPNCMIYSGEPFRKWADTRLNEYKAELEGWKPAAAPTEQDGSKSPLKSRIGVDAPPKHVPAKSSPKKRNKGDGSGSTKKKQKKQHTPTSRGGSGPTQWDAVLDQISQDEAKQNKRRRNNK